MSISNLQNYLYGAGYTYVVNPDRLYVSAFASKEVLEVNATTGEITNRIPSDRFPFQSILVNQELLTFTLWESTPSYIEEKDVLPWIFFLTCPPEIPRGIWHTTNTLLVGGLNVVTPVSVPNIYSVEIWKNGVNVGQSTTVFNGDELYLKLLTPVIGQEKIELPLFIGEGYHYFESTTKAVDNRPNTFDFVDVYDANVSTEYTSNTIVVSGIDADQIVPVSCTTGTIIRNGIDTGSNTSTATLGATIAIKRTTPSLYSTVSFSLVDIGGVKASWNTVSKLDANDTDPIVASFDFPTITGAELEELVTSDPVVISGDIDLFLEPLPDSQLIVNGFDFGYSASVFSGDSIQIRTKASYLNKDSKKISLLGRGFVANFTVTTKPEFVPDYLTYHTNHYVPLNGRTISNELVVSGLSDGESVELELYATNITNNYFRNVMDVRFHKNGIDVESNYVEVTNGDTLEVSAFVAGATWNGFVQEFQIFTVQRVYDEDDELLEIQRVDQVGFWRYVTAYLDGIVWNRQKEEPILIAHQYEKGLTYSKQIDVTEYAEKRPVYGFVIDQHYERNGYKPLSIDHEYVVREFTAKEISVGYEAEKVYRHYVTQEFLPVVSKPLHKTVDADYSVSKSTKKTIDTEFVSGGVTKREIDSSYVVSGVTNRTADTEYITSGVTKRTLDVDYVTSGITKRTVDTEFISGGVTKRTLDVDYIRSDVTKHTHEISGYDLSQKSLKTVDVEYKVTTKNIVLVDLVAINYEAIKYENTNVHELVNSAQPEVYTRNALDSSVEYVSLQKDFGITVSVDYSTDTTYHFKNLVTGQYEFQSGANTQAEFSTGVDSYTRSFRETEPSYVKEQYYHLKTVDVSYELGPTIHLTEFENPYVFGSSARADQYVSPDYEFIGTNGDIEVDHNYTKTGFSSSLSPEAQYHITEHSGQKLFDASVETTGRSEVNFELDVTTRGRNLATVETTFEKSGRSFSEHSSEYSTQDRVSSHEVSTSYVVDNAHTARTVTSEYEVDNSHSKVLASTEYLVNNAHSVKTVDVQYVSAGKTARTIAVDSFEVVTRTSKEIEVSGFETVTRSHKEISVGTPEVAGFTMVAVSRNGVEISKGHSHGEEDYVDAEFRAFDTEAEAITYAQNLGTIVNPKAMRLASGKWFYYGDADIQNASCKISFPYPQYGYLHGG